MIGEEAILEGIGSGAVGVLDVSGNREDDGAVRGLGVQLGRAGNEKRSCSHVR